MSIKYNFWESKHVYGTGKDNYCSWIGKYTIGYVCFRGTRLWLRPPYTVSFAGRDPGDIEETKGELKNGTCEFPGDVLNIRDGNLENIIANLEKNVSEPRYNDTLIWYKKSIEDWHNEFADVGTVKTYQRLKKVVNC